MLQRSALAAVRSVPKGGGGGGGAAAAGSAKRSRKQQQQLARRKASSASSREARGKGASDAYPRWHSVVAGAAAGAGSRLLTAPLDLLRIRRQLQLSPPPPSSPSGAPARKVLGVGNGMVSSMAQIARNEGGVRSLFRGNLAATYLWITYAAVQFSLYARTSEFISTFGVPSPPSAATAAAPPTASFRLPMPVQNALKSVASSPTAVAFASGATAGLCATLSTYPFDICRTNFAARGLSSGRATAAASTGASSYSLGNPPQSIVGFTRIMYRTRGIRGFYAGATPAAVQIVPYMGINFALYDYFVQMSDRHSVGNAGLAGTVAGGVSKFLVYPIDTIKKRLQAQAFVGLGPDPTSSPVQYKSMIDCATTMMREEGFAAFYRGLVPTVLKSCAATGFTFAFYTLAKNALEATHDRLAAEEDDEKAGWRASVP